MIALKTLHRWLLRAAALAVAMGVFVAPVRASFDEVAAGPRAAGMADAQTALADDASAAFNNPAGLIQIGDPRLVTEFEQTARGLSDGSKLGSTYLGYVHPIRPGETVLGFGYRDFKATEILEEKTYLLGAGRRLNIAPFGWEGVWSAGANLKMLERSFVGGAYAENAIGDNGSASGAADPLLNGGGKTSAVSADLGVLYQFGRRLDSSVGVMVMNANRPDISIRSGDRAPEIIKIGAAHRPKWGAVTAEIRRAHRLAANPDTDLALGAERNFRLSNNGAVTLRGGYAEGSRGYKAVTAGAAYHFGRFSFDYALSFPIGNLSVTDGTQRLGFSMRFGNAVAVATTAAIVPPMVQPVVAVATAAPTETAPIEDSVSELNRFQQGVTEDIATLEREIAALRAAANVAPSTTTVPAVYPAQPAPAPAAPVAVSTAPAPLEVVHPVVPVVSPKKPAALPHPAAPKPAVTPARRPAQAAPTPDAARAWQFYDEAVARDVSDQERMELLESMRARFGAAEAARINAEIEKIHLHGAHLKKKAQ